MSTPGIAVPGTVVPVSSLVAPGGAQGQGGRDAFNLTTAAFTIPAIGSTATVTLGDTSWCAVGEMVYVAGADGAGGAAALQITAISGSQLTLLNPTPPATIPLASTAGPGLLAQVSGAQTDYVGGDNACHALATALPAVSGWTKYNAIRNPEMQVNQRGTSGTNAGGTDAYGIDGWRIYLTSGFAVTWSDIQVDIPADTSGNRWYPHIQWAHRVTFTTGKALAAADNCQVYQPVEGNLAAPLKDIPSSLSLLVRASIAGTFSVYLQDSVSSYTYVMTGTISTPNVWFRIPFPNIAVFPGAGKFPSGNGTCYYLGIILAMGSNGQTSSLNTWNANTLGAATTQTNFGAATNNTFDFTVVQHEPNPVCTPYVQRRLEAEWALNLRYLCYPNNGLYLGWAHDGNWTYEMGRVTFPASMRAAPGILPGSVFYASSGNAGTPTLSGTTVNCANLYNNGAAWTAGAWIQFNGGFTAEL